MNAQRRTRLFSAATAVLAVAAFALIAPAPAPALAAGGTWHVAPSGVDEADCGPIDQPCFTIAAALDRAADGDTIQLAPGEYVEALVLDKDIEIVGAGPEQTSMRYVGDASVVAARPADGASAAPEITLSGVLVKAGDWPGLTVRDASVTITDSEFVSADDSRPSVGMWAYSGTVVIERSTFHKLLNAINVGENAGVAPPVDSGDFVLRDSLITDNINTALDQLASYGGLVSVERSTIENTMFGSGVTGRTAVVSNSIIRDNGKGGVRSSGVVSVIDTTIIGNGGFGVEVSGTAHVDVIRSSITGTLPFAPLAGTDAWGFGLIAFPGTTATIDSSTIWDSTGTGVFSTAASMDIRNSTIGGNRPNENEGLAFDAPPGALVALDDAPVIEEFELTITGSILSGGDDIAACVGPITDLGYNLGTDDSCGFDATGVNGADPQLGPLDGNGSETLSLLPARGPAVDAVPVGEAGCSDTAVDQRSFARLEGPRCDIGAVEVPQDPVVISTDVLPGGTVGEDYSVALAATGGMGAPYAWSIDDGELPLGLELSADGVISGVPEASGTFPLSMTVDAGAASAEYTLTVAPAEVIDPPVEPPVDPPADPAPVAPPSGDGAVQAGGSLPATGADPMPVIAIAGGLLLVGAAVYVGALIARRRRGQ